MSRKSWHTRKLGTRPLAPETLMMGYGYNPHLSERSLKPPLFLTSTFVFRSAEDGKAFFELAYGLRQKRPNEEPGLIYSRINNPDLEMLEDRLAIWDEAEGSLVFASGMAAIIDDTLGLRQAGHGNTAFRSRLWRYGFPIEEDPPAIRRSPGRF
jgi:methionine-gamma-lyase